MNADPSDQRRLLDLQALDTRLAQLAHRKRTLPERAEIERCTAERGRLRDLLVAATTEESDAARAQTKAEQDVEQVRTRAARDQQRMDSGVLTSPKDLDNLQRELASLAKRQGDLEDVVLEIMERREAAQARVAELTEQAEAAATALAEAEQRRDEASADIDKDTAYVTGQRRTIAGTVPADLVTLYDRLREQNAGVGAARLFQRRCEGCHLEFGVTEMNEIRAAAPEAVLRCENCRRILVRTEESGL